MPTSQEIASAAVHSSKNLDEAMHVIEAAESRLIPEPLGMPKPDTCVDNIVRDWLKLNGFDGLCHGETECGCYLDDFIICGGCFSECRPAYKFMKRNGDWWMSTNKHWRESEVDERGGK